MGVPPHDPERGQPRPQSRSRVAPPASRPTHHRRVDGSGCRLSLFLVARLLGIKTVYVEVYDRIDVPTLTGRLCHPLASRFLLQWEAQKRFYRRGQVIGRLF